MQHAATLTIVVREGAVTLRATTLLAALVLAFACAPDARRQDDGVDVPVNESLSVPQRCDVPAPPPGVRTVQVVFSCDEVAVGSWRVLPESGPDTLTFALKSLLAGPTPEERTAGLSSFFSDETAGMLNSARLQDGVAFVDFRDFSGIIPNASTSAGSTQLLDQIAGTIFQFDGVREAELSLDGSCDAFWNWLQRGCERLERGGPRE
jgi:hypothetical protein